MIYLDNCATTKIRDEVVDVMIKGLRNDFGNPSSLHRLGIASENIINESREIIADYLKVKKDEIYFTSGGTESNNIGIQGIINTFKNRGKDIITTKIEHPSVRNIMKHYETLGFNITYLSTDSHGRIDMEEFKESLNEETILVSIIHVNNETGIIQDIKQIKTIIDNRELKTILFVDGVQSFGKIDFSLEELGIDMYSFSSHKIHGPKGVGGLFIRNRLNLKSTVFGGNQEKNIRSGTENVNGILGFGHAVKTMAKNRNERIKIKELRDYMASRIQEEIEDIRINTLINDEFSPYILNISFNNIKGEVLLHYLEDKDIYVSTTSACSANVIEESYVLKSLGLNKDFIEGTIRFCLSYEISKEDIDYAIEILIASVKEIRKIIMR